MKKWQSYISDWMYYHSFWNEVYGVLSGAYKIVRCPVCRKLTVDINICRECGCDIFAVDWDEIERDRAIYRRDKATVGKRNWRRSKRMERREIRRKCREDWKIVKEKKKEVREWGK